MSSHPHFRWIRPVQQAGSQQTLERLLDSAEALIADKGFDDVSVVEIATRAGFSVGAIYSRFRDKSGVLQCLQDREPSAVERKERLVEHLGKCLSVLMQTRTDAIAHPNPAAALRFGLRFILGTLEQAILFEGTGAYGIPTSDEKLAEELTRAFLGYPGVEWVGLERSP